MQFIPATKKAVSKKATLIQFTSQEHDEVVRNQEGVLELHMGIGKKNDMTRRKLPLLLRRILKTAKEKKLTEIVLDVAELSFPRLKIEKGELVELVAVNMLMADFSFAQYKTKPKGGFPAVKKVWLLNASLAEMMAGLKRGKIIGEEVNRARHISTMPGGEMTPEILALHAKKAVKGLPIRVKILGVREMAKLKMGGVIAVGKGSQAKPKFIILEYFGGAKKEKPAVLIGKGVTFDTGGINLKPSNYILGMNMDMSGGASVIHALAALARLKVKKNIIVLVPAAENMPSGESYRPGDIIRSMSGKTIEVQDTDAEGRIILADALTYAKRYDPAIVFDVATLTGSAMVALGERATALFTADEKLESELRHIGERVGDYVWPLPLWDEYLEDIKGTFGDIGNVGSTKWGGAITAAVFLKQFVGEYAWVHLDIAPRMTTMKSEYLEPGGAGAGLRLLVRYLS